MIPIHTTSLSRTVDAIWRKFPFWYTVLALSEMNSSEATAELAYSAPALERAARRDLSSGVYARRRQQLAARTLRGL